MMPLPPKVRTKRPNETRDLTHPIEAALNRLPGVRVARNNNLGPVVPYVRRLQPDIRPIRAGLGDGSADLVGVCSVAYGVRPVGRAFCLEVKRPGVKPDADQVRWLRVVRELGGFACVVHSVDEAIAAVERCREGASE
jgi:hypothetical protein